jgi:hypothetical protein
MNKHMYTVPVPMPKGAFESWAKQYQELQEEFFELQIATSGYEDAKEVLKRIQQLPNA